MSAYLCSFPRLLHVVKNILWSLFKFKAVFDGFSDCIIFSFESRLTFWRALVGVRELTSPRMLLIPLDHPEGYLEGFAKIDSEIAYAIRVERAG